jgi:hypothetical protein
LIRSASGWYSPVHASKVRFDGSTIGRCRIEFRPVRSTRRMDGPADQLPRSTRRLAGSLVLGLFLGATECADAQAPAQGGSTDAQRGGARAPAQRQVANAARGAGRGAGQPRSEPSAAYRESIRRTVERRRQRRANRGERIGEARPVGGIVPWPLPPALVIRHTPEVHSEVESFLGLLRK